LRRYLPTLLGLTALVLVLALRVADPVPIQQLRHWLFDAYQRIEPRAYQPAGVRIVDIDEAALDAYGQWPWPRTVMAQLVETLDKLGAAAIVFDMVFAEPDRTAPDRLLAAWQGHGVTSDVRKAIAALPDPDTVFAETVRRAPVVTGFAPIAGEAIADRRLQGPVAQGPAAKAAAPARPAGFAFSGGDPAPYLPNFPGSTVNLAQLEQVAAGNGSITIVNDPDNVVREVPLAHTVDGTVYPGLTTEALRVAQGASTHIVKTSRGSGEGYFGGQVGITAFKIGRVVVPTTARGRLTLYDTGRVPARSVSAAQVLGADNPAELRRKVEGHIVLIGTSAVGLKDIRATPLSPATSGVSIHAQALEQMILGTFLARPDWATGAETLALLLVGGLLIVILPRVGALWCAVLGGTAVAAGVAGSWVAFDQARLLVDPLYPSLGALAVYLPMSSLLFFQTEREKRFVRQAFSRYLSPALVERLAAQPQALRLGGEDRELTLLFSDIRGFTGVAETMTPEELTGFMNAFLTPMTDEVMAHEGYIDKYMGDAIMAFWNAPLDVPGHPLRGAEAALAMRRQLVALNARWAESYAREGRTFPGVAVGIGLNTGVACVGNMGSEQRFDYSALGDNVNLASRLEGQSKTYGVDVVMSEATQAGCGSAMATLELDLIRVKGRQEPARVFTLVGPGTFWDDAGFRTFAETHAHMLAAYRRQDWDTAETACGELEAALADRPDWQEAGCVLSGIYALYRARIAKLRADPPGADWNAVFSAETK
jgi:adenylate cyclase